MPDVIDSMLLMFADDTKLYRTISSPIDHDILQQDISRIGAWGEQSLMSFNTDKCQVMTLGRSHEEYNYTMSKHGNCSIDVMNNKIWVCCSLSTLNSVIMLTR